MKQLVILFSFKGKVETEKIAQRRRKRLLELKKKWGCESMAQVLRRLIDNAENNMF